MKGGIYVGMSVRTSYCTGPYIVTDVTEDCTCPSFLDSLDMGDEAPASRPHYHLTCRKQDERKGSKYFLNGYDDNLRSVWGGDYLVDCNTEATILTLCCKGLTL